MSRESESSQERLKKLQPVLDALERGVLDGLECLECGRKAVSVRFTHPEPSEYRTWLVCGQCSFKLRVHSIGVPSAFSEDRVDEYLEAYDADLLKKRKF